MHLTIASTFYGLPCVSFIENVFHESVTRKPTDRRTVDGRTEPIIEMRGRI